MCSRIDDAAVPATVIVPTLGRTELLAACLTSLRDARPRASEILVVDGSESADAAALVSSFASIGARRLAEEHPSAAGAANTGLRGATHDTILFTHDDCIVATDWVGVGAALMGRHPEAILTGSVFPNGDPNLVPGLATGGEPHDYTGTRARVLLAHNMACSRRAVLEAGGFDQHMRPVAEDDDLAFRWLRAGRTLRYEPEMKVWHTAWRTEAELRRVYRVYAQGDGMVYAKHLLDGDLVMMRYILSDLLAAIRAQLRALVGARRPRDPRLDTIPNLLLGLGRGVRIFWGQRRRLA